MDTVVVPVCAMYCGSEDSFVKPYNVTNVPDYYLLLGFEFL
jgi:hypothetical protein